MLYSAIFTYVFVKVAPSLLKFSIIKPCSWLHSHIYESHWYNNQSWNQDNIGYNLTQYFSICRFEWLRYIQGTTNQKFKITFHKNDNKGSPEKITVNHKEQSVAFSCLSNVVSEEKEEDALAEDVDHEDEHWSEVQNRIVRLVS